MRDLPANKLLCCVRNPFDAFTSWLSMSCNFIHTARVKGDFLGELKEEYTKYMKTITKTFFDCHDKYIKYATEQNAFIYFFRYEDLLDNKRATLVEIFKFMLGVESIEGLNIERRIDAVLNDD